MSIRDVIHTKGLTLPTFPSLIFNHFAYYRDYSSLFFHEWATRACLAQRCLQVHIGRKNLSAGRPTSSPLEDPNLHCDYLLISVPLYKVPVQWGATSVFLSAVCCVLTETPHCRPAAGWPVWPAGRWPHPGWSHCESGQSSTIGRPTTPPELETAGHCWQSPLSERRIGVKDRRFNKTSKHASMHQ